MIAADFAAAVSSLVIVVDALLVSKGNLGIRDYGGQKECVGRSALGTSDPADAKADRPLFLFHGTIVVTVNREACGVPAETGQLMKLDIIYNRIIKGLRNLIAITDE
nr:hypothetical protein [Novisyntrophococcus fermenticellae]